VREALERVVPEEAPPPGDPDGQRRLF